MYLEPMLKIVTSNEGWLYKRSKTPVILMIDFKTEGTATYRKLKQILQDYAEMLSVYSGDSLIREKAIRILISGSSPIADLIQEDTSFVTIDVDLKNLENGTMRKIVTRYSSPWQNYFSWQGTGKMPQKQLNKLHALVSEVHAMGKQIRFYHIPDKEKVWRTLLNAGVDWINTNKLKPYRQFYIGYQTTNANARH